VTGRSLSELRSVCPGCGLRRFIPRYTAPYCTPSCKRDAAPSLFARCPACRRNPVEDPREVCAECVAAFGPMIRPSGREISAGEFAAELERGERAVAAILAERHAMVPLEIQ
jgi:hypothetical protein